MPKWDEYYDILGVGPAATTKEIRAAYRRKALELHPDRLPSASEAERHSAEEAFKKVNRAYEVLGNEERRRKYHAAWLQSNSPPKPVLEPSVIVFDDAEARIRQTGSFVIRNAGGAYSNIWFSDPDSWVRVTGYASLEPEDELPLRVEITASGHGWGQHYSESITVRLDGVEAAVEVQLHTKPAPAPHYASPAPATSLTLGWPAWGNVLGFAAAVAAVVMIIVTSIPEQTGAPANNTRSPVIQPWSTGSNYLGAQPSSSGQPGFPGSPPGYPVTQPSFPGPQPDYPVTQPSFPGLQPGYPATQPSFSGSLPGYSGVQPRSPVIQPSSPGFRPSNSGFRPSSSGFRPSSSGYQPSSPGVGRWP